MCFRSWLAGVAAVCVLMSAGTLTAQTRYRYVRLTTLNCSGEKYQEIDWYAGGTVHPTPKMTNVTSNGMRLWGDNADWELTQVYDGNVNTHAWLGDIAPPYTHNIYLDLGASASIIPDSVRITKPNYTTLRRFQCWASTDAVGWDLFLDTTLTSTAFAVRTFRLRLVADTENPSKPTGLSASSITGGSVNLVWNPSTDNRGIHEYRIYQNGTLAASTGNTNFAVTGLSASTTYAFSVVAVDRAGNTSLVSDTISVTTTAVDNTPPAPPTALAASPVAARSATLTWNASSTPEDVAGYVVYLNGKPVGTTEQLTMAIPGLTPSSSCRFVVRARDIAGNMSDSSATVTVSTPAAGTEKMTIGTNFWNIAWGGAGNDPFTATYNAVSGDNPWKVDFRNEIDPYVTLRFMDYGEVNNTAQRVWMERTQKAELIQNPMAFEWMIDLCNRSNRNLWVCVPHPVISRDTLEKGANDYVRKLAILVKHGVDMRDINLRHARFVNLPVMTRLELVAAGGVAVCDPLKPQLQLYIEYSNETWNFGFTQARYCANEGVALSLGGGDEYGSGRRFHAWAALRVFEETDAVFGSANPRVVRIDATHTGGTQNIRDHLAIYDSPSHNPLRIYPDAFSPAPYFGHNVNGSSGTAVADLRAAIVSSAANSRNDKRYIDTAGTNRGRTFRHIAYEGGQHVTTSADVINRNAAMYDLYISYLDSMGRYYDEFCHYAHCGTAGSGGAWGAKESIGQDIAQAHKYRAIINWLGITSTGMVDYIPPTIPTGLAAQAAGTGGVLLSWAVSTDASGVAGYQVFQNGIYIGLAGTNSYLISGLSPSAQYAYSLKAVDVNANVSRMSDTLVVTVGSSGVMTGAVLMRGAPLAQYVASERAIVVTNARGLRSIEVFDMAGRKVAGMRDIQSASVRLTQRSRAGGVLVVRMVARDGAVQTVRFSAP